MQGCADAIDQRFVRPLGGDARAIATAILTGRRDAVSEPVNDALFISGLGHILSISGYHMAVVAGVVFFAVRALLALIPALALGFPIKKWSAFAALLAVTFYLLLSGAVVATQRSFVMIAIVLVGVMADRRAITFRTLAIAALAVMIIAPESVVHPSFQMSFAATLGLVALIEQGMPRLFATPDSVDGRADRAVGRARDRRAHSGVADWRASRPCRSRHFTPSHHAVRPSRQSGRDAGGVGLRHACGNPWSDRHALRARRRVLASDGVGHRWMIAVSQWVAALPGAIGRVHAFGAAPLAVMSLGMIALALLRTPLRLAGAGIMRWA